MDTIEILKNVYVDDTVTNFLQSPTIWLGDREDLPVRTVGGLHNLSMNDKMMWAKRERDPLRIVEHSTGREEIWYPHNNDLLEWKDAPFYISLNQEGVVHSHTKYDSAVPAFCHRLGDRLSSQFLARMTINVWYNEGIISRPDDDIQSPSFEAETFPVDVIDEGLKEFIEKVVFCKFTETWADGEWKTSSTVSMDLVFADGGNNRQEVRDRALKWIARHCKGGFFPLSENLFGDKEEEFMFVADLSS